MSVVCCLHDGPITRPEESYRVWCVSVVVKPRSREDPGPLRALVPWGVGGGGNTRIKKHEESGRLL